MNWSGSNANRGNFSIRRNRETSFVRNIIQPGNHQGLQNFNMGGVRKRGGAEETAKSFGSLMTSGASGGRCWIAILERWRGSILLLFKTREIGLLKYSFLPLRRFSSLTLLNLDCKMFSQYASIIAAFFAVRSLATPLVGLEGIQKTCTAAKATVRKEW
jgi:hypothetical protein